MKRAEQGLTVLVVLVLLTVMMLGGLALARMTEVGTLASGNAAYREAALQASEVGINTAFAQLTALADDEVDTGTWYTATPSATDVHGIPMVDFDAAPSITVGAYQVNYVAERVCTGAMPVVDAQRQCLIKQERQMASADRTREAVDPPFAKQFRVTVRVTGPKGTQAWVQTLITKG